MQAVKQSGKGERFYANDLSSEEAGITAKYAKYANTELAERKIRVNSCNSRKAPLPDLAPYFRASIFF